MSSAAIRALIMALGIVGTRRSSALNTGFPAGRGRFPWRERIPCACIACPKRSKWPSFAPRWPGATWPSRPIPPTWPPTPEPDYNSGSSTLGWKFPPKPTPPCSRNCGPASAWPVALPCPSRRPNFTSDSRAGRSDRPTLGRRETGQATHLAPRSCRAAAGRGRAGVEETTIAPGPGRRGQAVV